MSPNNAAARSGLYRLLALALDFPCGELIAAIDSGEYQAAVMECARTVGVRAGDVPAFESVSEGLETAYLEIFELGKGGDKPCVLREGAHVSFEFDDEKYAKYVDGQPSLMEELLRFYHFFGVRLADVPENRLPPDHIVCQLEMLAHLSLLESRREQTDEIAAGYRNAQRDFLRSHVLVWWPKVRQQIHGARKQDAATRFYATVADFALAGTSTHLGHVS